jgi:hypothetical protein
MMTMPDGRVNSVISEGVATSDFTTTSATRSSLRLAALMDGLAIQLALEDPGMTPRRFTDLWWEAAVLELGITVPRRPRRR